MQEKDKTRVVLMNVGVNLDGSATRGGPRGVGSPGSPGARSDVSRQGTAKSTRRSLGSPGGSAGSGGGGGRNERGNERNERGNERNERPLAQQFGPAPRWGEPRMPPRPFQVRDAAWGRERAG
jgi:hypothetical protein